MPREITITLPDITEKTTDKELSFLPDQWAEDLLDACFEDGAECSREKFFFHSGFSCAMALLTDIDSTGRDLREFADLFFKYSSIRSEPIGRFLLDALADLGKSDDDAV